MNFFGHSVVAGWVDDSPGFVLGAMLPDFAAMCQARLADQTDADIARGVSHHHTVDRLFHRLPAFTALTREAFARLSRSGVSRGPARGAAHVAVELLLDGALLGRQADEASYLAAVHHAGEASTDIRWQEGDGAERFHQLHGKLVERGVPLGYADAEVVADLVSRILRRRPLLAPTWDDALAIRSQLGHIQRAVAERAGEIVSSLRDAMRDYDRTIR